MYTCNPGAGETDGKLSLAISASWAGEFSVQWQILSQKVRWKNARGRHKIRLWHPYAHTHTHILSLACSLTRTHARMHASTHTHQGYRLSEGGETTLGILLYHALPYSLKTRSAIEPGARLAASEPQHSWYPCLPQSWGDSHISSHAQLLCFEWALETWTQGASLCISLALEDGSWKRGLSWTSWLTLLILVPQRLRRAIAHIISQTELHSKFQTILI